MKKTVLKNKKKMIYDMISSREYVPMRAREMAVLLQIPKGRRKELEEVLGALKEEGKIEADRRGRYRRCGKKKESRRTVTGTFLGHAKGFGFVSDPGKPGEDLYIPEEYTGSAFHMDEVEAELLPGGGGKRREGRIIRVLSHGLHEVVGTFERSGHFGFVVPDNPKISRDIFVPEEQIQGAQTGQKVVVQISGYGDRRKSPEGAVTEILGYAGEAGVDVLSVARGRALPMVFPEKVLHQADRCPEALIPNDFNGRADITISVQDLRLSAVDADKGLHSYRIYEKLRRGEALTQEEGKQLLPTRQELAVVYRKLSTLNGKVFSVQSLLPDLKGMELGKLLLCLDMFQETGLVAVQGREEVRSAEILPTKGKVDIFTAPIYQRAKALAGEVSKV